MPVVFVVSRDWTLRTALRAELRGRAIDARGLETADDIGKALAQGIAPSVVVIDSTELEHDLAREQIANLAQQVTVLIVGSRIAPDPQIPRTERLERPITIGEIAARVLVHLTAAGN